MEPNFNLVLLGLHHTLRSRQDYFRPKPSAFFILVNKLHGASDTALVLSSYSVH